MSDVIDKRIVEMQFDNAHFERNATQSLSTIDKLSYKLESLMDGSALGGIKSGIGNIPIIGDIVGGIDRLSGTIRSKFGGIMDLVVADTVLKLKNGFETTAINLTLGQLDAGWQKYADKTSSVQTIMSAVRKEGETEEEAMARVTEQMEKLNWFTDETSYNFVDMVNNIGKFTSQGIELNQSVTAMQGIATWAAKSGANAASASRAMYNLSQALGLGAVRVQDWMSIENANMATKEFKEQVIEAAKELGTIEQRADGFWYAVEGGANATKVTVETFRGTLADNWFNDKVLLQVLGKYGEYADKVYEVSDAYDTCAEAMKHVSEEGMELGASAFRAAQEAKTFQEAIDATKDAVSTGWMNIYETIFGDYLEAKELWTDLAQILWEIFAQPVEKLNDFITNFKQIGGLKDIFDLFIGPFESGKEILDAFSESIENLFKKAGDNPKTVSGQYDALKVMENMKLSKIDELMSPLQYLATFLDTLIMKVQKVSKALRSNITDSKNLEKIPKLVNGIAAPIKHLWKLINTFFDTLNKHTDLFNGIENVIFDLGGGVGDLLSGIVDMAEGTDIAANVFDFLFRVITKVSDGIEKLYNNFKDSTTWFVIKEIATAIAQAFFDVADALSDLLKGGDEASKFYQEMEDSFFSLKKSTEGPLSWFWNIIQKIGEFFKGAGGQILDNIKQKIKDLPSTIEKIGSSISELWNLLSSPFKKAEDNFDEFNDSLNSTEKSIYSVTGLTDALKVMEERGKDTSENLNTSFSSLTDIIGLTGEDITKLGTTGAVIVGIISLSNAIVNLIDALRSIPDLLDDIANAPKNALKELVKPFVIGGITELLKSVAITIAILAGALFVLSLIPAERLDGVIGALDLTVGIITICVGALFELASMTSKKMSLSTVTKMGGILSALSLMIFAISQSILLIAASAWIFDKLENINESLRAVGATILLMAGILYVIKKLNFSTREAAAMAILGASLVELAASIALIAVAAWIFDQSSMKGLAAAAICMIMLGALLAGATKLRFDMSDAVAIVILAAATIPLAIGLAGVALACLLFKNVEWEAMGKAAVALGGLIVAVSLLAAVASKITDPKAWASMGFIALLMGEVILITEMLADVAIKLKTVDWSTMGKVGALFGGMIVVVAAFAIVAGIIGAIGPWAFIALGAIDLIGVTILLIVGEMLIIAAAAALIVKTFENFDAAKAQIIGSNFLIFLTTLANVLSVGAQSIIPKMFDALLSIIREIIVNKATEWGALISLLLETVAEQMSNISGSIDSILRSLIQILQENKINIFVLFDEVKVYLNALLRDVIELVGQFITDVLTYLQEHAEDWGYAAGDIISKFIEGFLTGLDDNVDTVVDAAFEFIADFMDACENSLDAHLPEFKEKGLDIFKAFLDHMFNSNGTGGALETIQEKVTGAAKNIISGLVGGLTEKNAGEKLGGAAKWMANSLNKAFTSKEEIESPSGVYEGYGKFIVEGLANGIENNSAIAGDSMLSLRQTLTDSLTDSIGDEGLNPVVTPVLDLDNLRRGAGQIEGMFGNQSVGISMNNAKDINTTFGWAAQNQSPSVSNVSSSQTTSQGYQNLDVTVMLEGDVNKFMKVMKTENNRNTIANGMRKGY